LTCYFFYLRSDDTVGVDLEYNLDLGKRPWSGRHTGELELAEEQVVPDEGAHPPSKACIKAGEDLALTDGDIAGDEFGHDTTSGLDIGSEDDIAQALVVSEDTAFG
jgi:hypothetical protein